MKMDAINIWGLPDEWPFLREYGDLTQIWESMAHDGMPELQAPVWQFRPANGWELAHIYTEFYAETSGQVDYYVLSRGGECVYFSVESGEGFLEVVTLLKPPPKWLEAKHRDPLQSA
jgi:hypothetical protein